MCILLPHPVPVGGPPPSSGSGQYGPPPSGGRDYYDDPYYSDAPPPSRPADISGYGPPPDSGSYRSRPSEFPASGRGDYPPPKRSDGYDSYSSAPPSQSRDSYSSYSQNGTGSSGYRSGGPPGPTSTGRPTRFSAPTGPDSGYGGSQASYDYKGPGGSDPYYSTGGARGPASYSSDASGHPPPSKAPVDRYGGPPSGGMRGSGDVGSRSGFSDSLGTGLSSSAYGGLGPRGYDTSAYIAPRGGPGSTAYGGSTASSAGIGRGGSRPGGYQSSAPQGGGPQVPPKVGYSAYGPSASQARPTPGQSYGQEYKPGPRY